MATVAAEMTTEIRTKIIDADALTRYMAQLRQAGVTATRTGSSVGGALATGQQRAVGSALSLAQAQARLAVAMGDTPRAVQLLNQALLHGTTGTTQFVNAQRQLIGVQGQAVASTSRLSSAIQGINSTMGAFGAAASIGALVKLGGDALSAANSLEKTKATVLALSGSQGRYNEVLAIAIAGQQKYGGSLEENIGGLGSLVNLSNKAGVSLAQLDNIARRLAIVDPIQGIEGANAALKEFASGNIGTLATRFELSRSALRALNDESLSMAERFNALDASLTEMGISSAVLDNATKTNAASFTRLSAEASNARDAVGALIGQLLAVPAQVTTGILVNISSGLSQLAQADAQLTATQNRILEVSSSFTVFQQNLNFANEQLAPFGASIGGLTEQQFAFARGLMNSGTSAADAMAKVREFGGVIQAGALAQGDWAASSDALINSMLALAATTDGNRAAIQNLSQAYLDENISASVLEQAVARLSAMHDIATQAAAQEAREQRNLAGAHFESAAAADAAAAATERDALQAQIASVQAEVLGARKSQLAQVALNAANALIASGNAGEATAARLANSSSLIDHLTAAYLRLHAAQASAGAAMGRPETGGDALARSLGAAGRNQQFLAAQSERAAKAQRDQVLAVGSQSAKVKILQSEYDKMARLHGANSEQAIKAETALLQAQQKGAAGGRAAHAAAGAARLTDQQKLHNTLLADEEKLQDQIVEAERAHQQKVLDIEADFLEKSLEQQRANDVSKRQSRADFYDSLTSATKEVGPKVAQELSAAYEQAYAQAQAIAQAGNAKLAADYLALKEEQIRAELEFQKKLAAAKEAGDKAEVERLNAVHKLRQDAQAEEEKQLLAGGDANVKDRDAALSEEEKRFAEQQGKIGTAAESAAERKVNAAIRSGKAVEVENAKLLEQEAILNRIGPRAPGAAGAGTGAVPTGPAAGATATPAGPPDLAALAAQLQAIVDALHTEGGRIVQAQQDTTGAVRSMGARLSGA